MFKTEELKLASSLCFLCTHAIVFEGFVKDPPAFTMTPSGPRQIDSPGGSNKLFVMCCAGTGKNTIQTPVTKCSAFEQVAEKIKLRYLGDASGDGAGELKPKSSLIVPS